jgi:hypothetical protein
MILHFPGAASQFTTLCAPGHSTHTPSENKFTPPFVRKNLDSCYLGKVNSSHCCAFLWAQLPTNFCTSVELVCPVASGGTIADANIDLWFLGIENTLGNLSYQQKVYWHTWDDATPVRTNDAGAYVYLLDGRFPVKIQDNAISAGTKITGGSVPVFRPGGLMTQIGLSFNRGAKMGDYMLIRFNPDRLDMNGQLRFAGGTTEVVAQSNLLAGAELYPAQKICYSAPDGVPVPQPRLSAAEQAGESYVRSTVNWVQYRDSDGASGFSYPAYCGVKDGKTRDLYFTIDAPAYTLTNAWLTLNALPPFTGSLPKGAQVSLSLVGFADAPAADEDFVVTDAMFAGQTPVLLQENVLRGGLSAGKSLFTDGVGQRNLIRALNARVKEAAMVQKLGYAERGGKKAVFRLAVETAGNEGDWGFSIGSAATPGMEAFFEAIEYRKLIKLFSNTGFEEGLKNWTLSQSSWTDDQAGVVEDPTDPSNHCLRFSIKNLESTAWLQAYQSYRESVETLRGRPYYVSYRVYVPSSAPIKKRTDKLTEFGWWLFWGRGVDNSGAVSDKQIAGNRSADEGTACDKWREVRGMYILPDNITEVLRIYVQFRFEDVDRTANEGDTIYYDDVIVEFEDFYEYPKERKMFHLIVR